MTEFPVVTLLITGYSAYIILGAVPLIGGAVQNKVRKKIGLKKKKVKSVARGRGIGLRRKDKE